LIEPVRLDAGGDGGSPCGLEQTPGTSRRAPHALTLTGGGLLPGPPRALSPAGRRCWLWAANERSARQGVRKLVIDDCRETK